jgi:hypothetical protein
MYIVCEKFDVAQCFSNVNNFDQSQAQRYTCMVYQMHNKLF